MHVLAGPGTGKTFALMRKVARLLEEGHDPSRILVVTFTRTAAQDLQKQLEELGIQNADRVVACTLHSLCFRILQREHVLEDVRRSPRILFPFEIDHLLLDLGENFGTKKDRKKRLEAFQAAWARLQHEEPGDSGISKEDRRFGQTLKKWLVFHNAMLLGELVPLTLRYLTGNPDSPERDMFDHILVDEYQDLNKSDQVIIDRLADNATLTVAGDDHQSIYGFRYAHPEGIIEFPERHEGTCHETLTECRRSAKKVVDMANRLIQAGGAPEDRLVDPWPDNPIGETHLLRWRNPDDETEGIREIVASYLKSGSPEKPGDILVLTPRKSLGARLRAELEENFIPAETVYTEEAIATPEARAKMCVLHLIADPGDRVALRYWLGMESPSALVGGYARIMSVCDKEGMDPVSVLECLKEKTRTIPHTAKIVPRYSELQAQLDRLEGLEGEGFIDAWLPEGVDEIRELRDVVVSQIDPKVPRAQMLRDILVATTQLEVPSVADYLRIMTLHKAKGLGAHTVIVLGAVDGLLPMLARNVSQEEFDRLVYEQRRLMYVAITRAKFRLIVSTWSTASQADAARMRAAILRWAGRGVVRVRPSRFFKELAPIPVRLTSGREFIGTL